MALTKEDLQAISELIQQSEQRIKDDMREGFDRLEHSINMAGKDIAHIEKRLNEHEAKPHIA